MNRLIGAMLVALSIAYPLASHAADDAARARLAGRTLDVVVAFSNSGSGARFWALFADALRKQIPETTIRARFNDAGSGSSAANELFALPEGSLAVGFVRPPELAFAQTQGREDVKFDLGAASWIISVDRDSHFVSARKGLPLDINVLRQPDQHPIVPVNGIQDTQTIMSFILNAVTGVRGKIVVGFNSSDRLRAIVAGDADYYTNSIDDEINGLLDSGDIVSLYTLAGDDFPPSVDRTRTLASVALPEAPQSVLDYVVAARALGRSFYAPPGVAAADVEALRTVFEEAMHDPDLIAGAKAQNVPLAIVTGSDVQAQMDILLLRDPAQKAAVQHAFECGRAMSEGTLDHCDFGP